MKSRWVVVEPEWADRVGFDLEQDGHFVLFGATHEEVEQYMEDFGSSADEVVLEVSAAGGMQLPYEWERPPRWKKE